MPGPVMSNCYLSLQPSVLLNPSFWQRGCPDFTRSKVSPDPELSLLVTWIEPIATDNAGQVTTMSNYRPDQPFKDGIWRVQYNATDSSGNIIALCVGLPPFIGYNLYSLGDFSTGDLNPPIASLPMSLHTNLFGLR